LLVDFFVNAFRMIIYCFTVSSDVINIHWFLSKLTVCSLLNINGNRCSFVHVLCVLYVCLWSWRN